MSSLVRKFVVNTASNVAIPLSSFLTAPILAHGLGVVGRGDVAGATAPLLVLAVAGSLGLPEAVTYYTARSRANLSSCLATALWLTLLSGCAFTICLYLLSGPLSRHELDLQKTMVTAGLALIPTLLIGVARGAAIGLQSFRLVFWERLFSNGARLLVLFGLWVSDHLSPLSAACSVAYVPLLGALAYIPLGISLRLTFLPINVRLIKYGARMWIGLLSGIMLSRIDQLFIIPLSSSVELGLYAVAVSISEVPLVLNTSLREVLFAADSAENNRERMARMARLSSLGTAIICLVVGAVCPVGIPFLFGSEFAAAIEVTAILLLAVAIGNPGSIAATALISTGRPGLRSLSLTVACAINIVALVILVPHIGALGAAWATLIGNIFSSTIAILFCRLYAGYGLLDFYGLRSNDFQKLRIAISARAKG